MLKATFRSFLAHKGRMVLSAIAVLLSVAFVSGTLIFTDTITKTFDELFKSTASDVTVSPKSEFSSGDLAYSGQTATLPASMVQQVASVPGVAKAYPDISVEGITVVNSRNKAVGATNGAPTIGMNWYTTTHTPVKITSGHAPHGAGEMMIDADTASKKHLRIGDDLRVLAGPGNFPTKIVGIVTFTATNPGATLAIFDTPTAAQHLLGDPNAITTVTADASPGVSNDELKQRVVSKLGGDVTVRTAKEQADKDSSDIGSALDFIKYAMLGFAGIAVLVGIFLIFNTFSMLVAQRTRELGLMRAIGASRRDVNRSVMTEALLLGLVGSTLGFGAGFGLAAGLKALISKAGMNLKGAELVLNWPTPVAAYLVGTIVTLLAAYVPARRASRVSPMAALREAGAPPQKSLKVRGSLGGVLLVLGALALVVGGTSDDGKQGGSMLGLGVLATLIAFVVLGPVFARLAVPWLAAPFAALFGPMGRLSRENALRNPRRTGATASALMIGVALVAALSVVASSMSDSISKQIDDTLGADFTVQASNGAFNDDVVNAVKQVPGVGSVTRELTSPATLSAGGKTSKEPSLFGADPGAEQGLKQDYVAGSGSEALRKGQIIVGEDWARDHHVGMGDKVQVTFANGRSASFEIGALTKKTASAVGGNPITISSSAMRASVPSAQNALVFINAASGADKTKLGEALKAAEDPFPQVTVRNQADYKDEVQKQINTLLYMIYGLLALAIIIAILGVVNTLALSVVERTREIGLMRAIGTSRRQIRRLIRVESTVIAVFGAVLGLVLGLSWGVVAQRLLATQGLDVLTVPWPTVVVVVVVAALVGLLAALLPALRASRMNVLNAIASE